MKGYWENLRPFEKRVVVGVATMLFAIFNLWFVLPHFSDLAKMGMRLKEAQTTLETRQAAINQTSFYQGEVNKLQREGLDVPPQEQALQFNRTITDEEMRSGVNPQGGGRIFTRTNQIFLEQTSTINVEANEQQLVDFLFNLGSGNSLIRVRDLGLHPDGTHQKIVAAIKLVASYQKNPSKTASPAGTSRSTRLTGTPSPADRSAGSPAPQTVNPPPQPGKKTTN